MDKKEIKIFVLSLLFIPVIILFGIILGMYVSFINSIFGFGLISLLLISSPFALYYSVWNVYIYRKHFKKENK